MIDFKEEISKYKPIMGIDDVENVVNEDVRDVMDMLQHMSKQLQEMKR